MTLQLILCLLLLIMAGIAYAAMWKLYFHFNSSIFASFSNQMFWDPQLSWLNKWTKNSIGHERFWGSSRWFVWLTDGFHFLQFWFLLFISAVPALFITIIPAWPGWVNFLLVLLAIRVIFSTVFEIFLSKVFAK